MTNQAIIMLMFAGALGVASAEISPATAQSTLGGAKAQQNKIGGVAKPAPVVGGATIHSLSPPTPLKPAPVAGIARPGSPGITTPGATPPVTPPNKGGTVVTSNLKCGAGACSSKGPKP